MKNIKEILVFIFVIACMWYVVKYAPQEQQLTQNEEIQ